MANSLWDHEQRLVDLEGVLHVLLELTLPPTNRKALVKEAARLLQARGQDGAARLLLSPHDRAHAR